MTPAGGRFWTVRSTDAVLLVPVLSQTVRRTAYGAPVGLDERKMWVAARSLEVEPSPKSQSHETMDPSASVLVFEANDTGTSVSVVVTFAVIAAWGAKLRMTTGTVAEAAPPSPSATVRITVK